MELYKKTRESVLAHWASKKKENPIPFLLYGAKKRAKKKGLPFNISDEDVPIPSVCPVLGIPLFTGSQHSKDNSPSIDRIIPSLGYTKGNVRVISNRANSIKRDATAHELAMVAIDLLMKRSDK